MMRMFGILERSSKVNGEMRRRTMPDLNSLIIEKAKAWEEETIQLRTYFHENPEMSSEEFATAAFLKEEIQRLGLDVEEVPGSTTGFTALLDTGKPGKTLGIRTDMDALPVTEHAENLVSKRAYISKNPGVMHACGHDGHMAILLTTMKIMHEMKDQLTGKIYFIFEEGEEIGAGIEAMVAHLADKKLDAVYGNHLAAFLDSGKVAVDEGPKMAGANLLEFFVHGQSGHASRPDLAVNPVFAAAQVLTALTNAWANQVDVTKTVTLSLTQIHGGSAHNVIPNEVSLGGSLRFFDVEEGERATEILKKVATLTAEAHNCTMTFVDNDQVTASPVINDARLAELAEAGVEEVLPGAQEQGVEWFASEPFNQYQRLAPVLFTFIGIRNEAFGSGAEHHNDKFDIDENALINGVLTMTKFAVDFLTKE